MLDHLLSSDSEPIQISVDLERYLEKITSLAVVDEDTEENLEILMLLEIGCPGGTQQVPVNRLFSKWLGNIFDKYGQLVPSPIPRFWRATNSTPAKPSESGGEQLKRWMETHPLLCEWILAYTHADDSIVMMFPAEFEHMRQQIDAKFRDLDLSELLPQNSEPVQT